MGRGIVESGLFRSERYGLEVRTTDPATYSEGEAWIRSDVAPDTDQIATLRFANGGGTIDIPIYATGTAGQNVSEAIAVQVGGQQGYIPIASGGATYSQLRAQHAGSQYQFHDAKSASALPDSVIDDFEDNLNNWGTVTDASVQSGTVQDGSAALGVDDGSSDPRGIASQPGDGLPEYPTRGGRYEWYFQIAADALYQFNCFAQSAGLGRVERYVFNLRPSSFSNNPDTLEFAYDDGSTLTSFDTDPFDLSANTGSWLKMILDAGYTTTNVFTCTIEDLNGNQQAQVSADPTGTADLTGGGWLWQTLVGTTGDFYADQFIGGTS